MRDRDHFSQGRVRWLGSTARLVLLGGLVTLVVALLKLVVGVAFALTYVASVTIANELSPARLRATGQALIKSTMFGLAPIIGALGGGIVYGALGARVMFLASTVVVAAAGAIALAVVPVLRRSAEPPRIAVEAAAPATP